MQSASRPTSLGLISGPPFRSRGAALVLLAFLAVLALAASTGAQQAGLTCTISASANGFDATFSGTISGSASVPNWTLHFGDGTSDSGSGTSVYDAHTYSALGTYTVTLDATGQSFTGGPVYGSCSTRVTIQATFTVSVQDGVTASDNVTYIPPLSVTDSISVSDRAGNYIPLAVIDTATVGDSPLLNGPGHFGESANLTDSAVATLGSKGAFTLTIVVTTVVVGVGSATIVAWMVIFARRLGRSPRS